MDYLDGGVFSRKNHLICVWMLVTMINGAIGKAFAESKQTREYLEMGCRHHRTLTHIFSGNLCFHSFLGTADSPSDWNHSSIAKNSTEFKISIGEYESQIPGIWRRIRFKLLWYVESRKEGIPGIRY